MATYPLLSPRSTQHIRPEVTEDPDIPALGRPRKKSLFDTLDMFAVTLSVAILAVSICVVTPHLSLSWTLGFKKQLVVIGFMISIMNLCLKRIVPHALLLVEARWGLSSLPVYEAIIRGSVTISQTHNLWRAMMFFLTALPLALSVAYKQFLGGTSGTVIHSPYNGYYGTSSLPMGNADAASNALYLAFNATNSFSGASSSTESLPTLADFPVAYGYNALLLSNTSAAMLDLPTPKYIRSIQQNLSATESWYLSATINGTVTTFDTSIDRYRKNDTFWNKVFAYSSQDGLSSQNGLSSWRLYNGYDLGALVGTSNDSPGAYCLAGFYKGSAYGEDNFLDLNDSDPQLFRPNALLYRSVRQRCAARWEITRSNVHLLQGSCSGVNTNQSVFQNSVPFLLDAMPVMVHSLAGFAQTGARNSSEWLMPTFVMNVAAMHWSRMVFMNGGVAVGPKNAYKPPITQPELYYPATNETIRSTVATLNAGWRLYLVLTVQPALTIAGFVLVSCFFHYPIGKGFGLVSILAGIEKEGLPLLKGASFSGELRRPVRLKIDSEGTGAYKDADHRDAGGVRYSLVPYCGKGRVSS